MANTTTKFCTLNDVKTQMNNAIGHNSDDVMIAAHIVNATALVRQYTRRKWETGTYIQFFNTLDVNIAINQGASIARFTLKEKPLQSITSVKFQTSGRFENAVALNVTQYTIDTERNSIVMYPGVMHSHARALEVTYVAGFPIDALDTDLLVVDSNIRAATAIQAAFTVNRVINETQNVKSKASRIEYELTSSGLVSSALALLRGETRLLMGGHA